MDNSAVSFERKRIRQNSEPDELHEPNSSSTVGNGSLVCQNLGKESESSQPVRKKPKYSAPRPLRLLKAPSLSSGPKSTISSSSSSSCTPLPSFQSVSSSSTAENGKKRKNEAHGNESPSTDMAHTSLYCTYCRRSIEGGEAGKRRHQHGQKHVFKILRGIDKYVAPIILPFANWRFPRILAPTTPISALISLFDDQERLIERFESFLELEQTSRDENYDKDIADVASKIDMHLAVFLLAAQPRNMRNKFKKLDRVYGRICELNGTSPIPMKSIDCPLCEAQVEYATKPAWEIKKSEENLNDSSASETTPLASKSIPSDERMNEEFFENFLRHLASEQHRKIVEKFWRDHNVSHPDLPSFSKLSPLPSTGTMLKKHVHPRDDPYTSDLFKKPKNRFEASSYALTGSQLQQCLDSWSKLRKMIALVSTSAEGVPQEELFQKQNFFSPVMPYPYVLPYPVPYNTAPREEDLSLKERIWRFAVPESSQNKKSKFKERVGSRWANAVKAYMAANPGTSAAQLIKLSRLERMGDASKQPSNWFPSFGGVWNESTRSEHRREHFRSHTPNNNKKH